MPGSMKLLRTTLSLWLACLTSAPMLAAGQESPENKLLVELEAGPVWFSRNDVRIPNEGGTRFDMRDLTDSGPDPYFRLYATYDFDERHSLRLNLAPLSTEGSGRLEEDVLFKGAVFFAEDPTEGSYTFSTYRLGYRYMLSRGERWDWGIGAVLLVRDAEIALRQGAQKRVDDDTGVVPLLHLYGEYRMGARSAIVLDFEGAGSGEGRAIDAAIKYRYTLPSGWQLAAGYRTLEGGADNDDIYTFAWAHYAAFSIGYEF